MHENSLRTSPVWDMLSAYGKRMVLLADGVLGQTAQARREAYAFNATLGEARENGEGMYLASVHRALAGFPPGEVYPYAPPAGLPELRRCWREKALAENPSLAGKAMGLPVVCAGLTHGLSLLASLFLDPGDPVVLHDKHWENYDLIFETASQGRLVSYPTFSDRRFHVEGLRESVLSCPGEKVFVVLNFPNNPTGYMPSAEEADAIAGALEEAARAGKRITVLCDDAYYGFWYGGGAMEESLFGRLAGVHPNLLAIRLDGATKEYFAGGLRLGFITYGGQPEEILSDLENRTAGAIRMQISSSSHFAQAFLLRCLDAPEARRELEEKRRRLAGRGWRAMELCRQGSGAGLWRAYPFRAGYFICLHVETDSESLRRRLLRQYGMGVIALGGNDIRIALPCLELPELERLFQTLDQAIGEVEETRA